MTWPMIWPMTWAMIRVLVAFTLLGTVTSRAQDLPEAVRGTWMEDGCARPGAALHVTARSVAQLGPRGEQRLWRARTVTDAGGWTVATAGDAEQPRLLLRRGAEGLHFAQANPKLRDDQLPGAAQPLRLTACPGLPLLMAALHGEGVAFLQGLETLEPACSGNDAPGCVAAFMAYADVSRDERLTPAEVARVLRGAVWAVQMAGGATAETLGAGLAVAAGSGVIVARLFVEALDYEGRGSITAAAVLQDRAPFPLAAALRPAPATPLPLEQLAEELGPLASLFGLLPDLLK